MINTSSKNFAIQVYFVNTDALQLKESALIFPIVFRIIGFNIIAFDQQIVTT